MIRRTSLLRSSSSRAALRCEHPFILLDLHDPLDAFWLDVIVHKPLHVRIELQFGAADGGLDILILGFTLLPIVVFTAFGEE